MQTREPYCYLAYFLTIPPPSNILLFLSAAPQHRFLNRVLFLANIHFFGRKPLARESCRARSTFSQRGGRAAVMLT
jgi:hypothetical protein